MQHIALLGLLWESLFLSSQAASSNGSSRHEDGVSAAARRYRNAVSLALDRSERSDVSLLHQSKHALHAEPVGLRVDRLPPSLSTYSKWFSKFIPVFGMPVLGGPTVPHWMVEHVASVFAQYLDWDADGKPDNPLVLETLLEGGILIGLCLGNIHDPSDIAGSIEPQAQHDNFHDGTLHGDGTTIDMIPAWAKEDKKAPPGRKHTKKNLFKVESNGLAQMMYLMRVPYKSTNLMRSSETMSLVADQDSQFFDATIEEVLHTIFDMGYGRAYPHVFSTEPDERSLIVQCMIETIGDCGYAFNHSFKYPNCTGHWHYDEEGCSMGCLASEYTFRSLVTLLGGFDGSHNDVRKGVCRDMQDEWPMCTAAELEKYEPRVVRLYDLHGRNPYGVPAVLPDGDYRPKSWPNMSLNQRYQSTPGRWSTLLYVYERYHTVIVLFGLIVLGSLLSSCKHMNSKLGPRRARI